MDEEFIASVVEGFKDGSWPGKEFRHVHHRIVAVHYIAEESDPMAALRTGIRRYNVSQGGENTEDRGYHETVTRFWVESVRACIEGNRRSAAGLIANGNHIPGVRRIRRAAGSVL